MESDSFNAISRVNLGIRKPWELHLYFNKIKSLVSHLQVVFHCEARSANGMADSLAN